MPNQGRWQDGKTINNLINEPATVVGRSFPRVTGLEEGKRRRRPDDMALFFWLTFLVAFGAGWRTDNVVRELVE